MSWLWYMKLKKYQKNSMRIGVFILILDKKVILVNLISDTCFFLSHFRIYEITIYYIILDSS